MLLSAHLGGLCLVGHVVADVFQVLALGSLAGPRGLCAGPVVVGKADPQAELHHLVRLVELFACLHRLFLGFHQRVRLGTKESRPRGLQLSCCKERF